MHRATRLALPAALSATLALSACGSAESSPGGAEPTASVGTTLELVAEEIAFDTLELSAPAGEAFAIRLVNRDQSIPHDVDIRRQDGSVVVDNEPVNDAGEETFTIPALEAGEYVFICSIHPIPAMTGTLTVE